MSKDSGEQVVKQDPWGPQQPYLQYGFDEGMNLFQNYRPEYYPGQTFADFDPLQSMSQDMMLDYAGEAQGMSDLTQNRWADMMQGGSPYLDYASQTMPMASSAMNHAMMQGYGGVDPSSTLDRLMSGDQFNPYMDDMVSGALRQGNESYEDSLRASSRAFSDELNPTLSNVNNMVTDAVRQYTEGVAPTLRNEAVGTGGMGSSRYDLAHGTAAGRIGERLTDQLGNIANTSNINAGRLMSDYALGASRVGQGAQDTASSMYGNMFENSQNRAGQAASTAANYGLGQSGQALNAAQNSFGNFGNAWDQYTGDQFQGMGMTGDMMKYGLIPAEMYGQVGGQRQGMENQYINDSMNRWDYYRDLPYDQFSRYQAGITGNFGGVKSTPMESSPLAGAAGGALTGWAASGNPWGAAVGGGLGLLGSL